MDVALLGRVAARRIATCAHPLLRQLAHVPVLLVDHVPEVDRVGRVEVVARDRAALEEPLAGDVGLARRARPQGVEHHVVGMQRDERVREQGEVENRLGVLVRETLDRRAVAAVGMGAVLHRHRRGVLAQGHRAAAPGPLAGNIVAAHVVAERVQLRVHAGAVQALVVVLGDPLPVRHHLVVALAGALELGEPVAVEVLDQVADVLVGVRRLAGEVDQHQAADDGEPHPEQAVAGEVEVLDLVHVRGGPQLALEVIGPGVVGAAQALAHLALGLLDQAGAAVATDVEEGARMPVLAADDDDAVVAELAHQELARLVDRGDVPDADPAAVDLVDLPLEHRLIGEGGRGQHRRPLDRLLGPRDLARVERQCFGRHRHHRRAH